MRDEPVAKLKIIGISEVVPLETKKNCLVNNRLVGVRFGNALYNQKHQYWAKTFRA